MDWVEKKKEEMKKKEQQEAMMTRKIEVFVESGILEKIERKRDEAEKEAGIRFTLSPPLSTGLDRENQGRFTNIKERNYTVNYGIFYFSLTIKEDGFYLTFSDKPSKEKKIDPQRITEKEIHDWFGYVVECADKRRGV